MESKDPGQILIDLRAKFREATTLGLVNGEQRTLFELTLISIINEAEEQRQKCLKLKQQYEREAAKAEAQASSYSAMENMIYNIFGSIINKTKANKQTEEEIQNIEKENNTLTEEELNALSNLKQMQNKKKEVKSRG
jgi:hypothetical protein